MAYPSFSSLSDYQYMESESEYKKRKDLEKSEYQQSLFTYNETLTSRDDGPCQYRQVVQPFQLVVDSDPEDFTKGLGEGLKKAQEKMALAVSNYMKAQVMSKDWPIDTFSNHKGKLCYGITMYLLTDPEMQQLEDILHNGLEAQDGDQKG